MKKIKAYGICVYKISKNNNIKVLLCKSSISKTKWGILKGAKEVWETNIQTAQREFLEESSIQVDSKLFEQYFEQLNPEKDIGIFLVNGTNIKNLDLYFHNDTLYSKYLSWENSKVKFFDISQLPIIKKKQSKLIIEIISFLKTKLI